MSPNHSPESVYIYDGIIPTHAPTNHPTSLPTATTTSPTNQPTNTTIEPTSVPTIVPSINPTDILTTASGVTTLTTEGTIDMNTISTSLWIL